MKASALQLQLDNPYDAYKLSKQGLRSVPETKTCKNYITVPSTPTTNPYSRKQPKSFGKPTEKEAINHAIQQRSGDQQSLMPLKSTKQVTIKKSSSAYQCNVK